MEPRHFLRVEGLAALSVALGAYALLGGPLWLLAALALAPDLSMLGYLAGPKLGSLAYNVAHTYTLPLALGGAGVWADARLALLVAAVWAGHIGADRLLGYGLKYGSGFRDTHLTDRIYYKFLTGWRSPPAKRLETVDITDLTDKYQARVWCTAHGNAVRAVLPDGCEPVRSNAHTGYYFDSSTFKRYQDTLESLADTVEICGGPNSWGRPYKFDPADFIRFLGWFITEGSVYWKSTKDTAEVKIAQKTERYRQAIRSLFARLGVDVCASPSGFTFSSTVYGELLERLCGATSQHRQLPWFIWDLPPDQKRLLLDTLLAGDGNKSGTYYTASEQLAFDVIRLAIDLGITPRYSNRYGGWQVYINRTKDGFRSALSAVSGSAAGRTWTYSRVSAGTGRVASVSVSVPAVLSGDDSVVAVAAVSGWTIALA